MLSIKFIRENPDIVKENLKKRKDKEKLKLIDNALDLDKKYREFLHRAQELRHKKNTLSQRINLLKKERKPIDNILSEVKAIPGQIKEVEEEIEQIQSQIKSILREIPNMMHPDVPYGKDESENKVIKTWGKITKPSFKVKSHVELIEKLGLADFETSAKISGKGFYFLKGELALFNQALIRFTIDFMKNKNYTYVEPPLLIHKKILDAALDLREFDKTIYKIDGEDLYLIGTSEHALLGLHSNQTIPEQQLPKKYFSYSMCFRKEIGSHGINEKGLWRTHQFNKIEQFIFCRAEDSWKLFEELLKNSEEIMQALKLPYRVVEMCTGDLSIWKARAFDIEVYRPTIKGYGEVMSLSNCTDFQSRDLNIKVLKKNNDKEIIHTLNNTAMATSRIMVAIIENYQNKDGSITIPKVLQPYMGGLNKITNKNGANK